MAISGIGHSVVGVLLSEVRTAAQFKLSFPTGKQFASWLGLCPDNRISGGRILGRKTRPVQHRLAEALRLSAFALWRNKSGLGDYCRKMKGRLGKAEGITATAHKLARALYAMIIRGEPYEENKLLQTSPAAKARKLLNLQKRAQELGFKLIPAA